MEQSEIRSISPIRKVTATRGDLAMERDLLMLLDSLFHFPRSNLEGFEMSVIELFYNENDDDECFPLSSVLRIRIVLNLCSW